MDESIDIQKRLKEKSLSGESGKRDADRTIRMKWSSYKRTLAALSLATAITVTTVIGGGSAVVNHLKDKMADNSMTYEFKTACIVPETHRTEDRQHYYYDYPDIADYIEAMDDFDLGVYLLNRNVGDYQTDQVMQYTEYKSFKGYLDAHQYDDSDAFRNDMHKQAVLTSEIQDRQAELAAMKAENTVSSTINDVNQLGGK